MNGLRLMWLVSRGLRYLYLAVIVVVAVAGCQSNGSNGQSGGSIPQTSSSAIGTDAASLQVLGQALGSSLCAPHCPVGPNEPSVPVRASASYTGATGITNYLTEPFRVNTSTLIVHYSYDCLSTGGSKFVASMDLLNANGSQMIADVSGSSGSATVTVHPPDVPEDYILSVSSPCSWTIVVENG